MAYSGAMDVYHFLLANQAGRIAVATTGIDLSGNASADVATMIVPVPLVIFAFGVVVQENLAASAVGSLFLERSTVIVGTDTTVVELDYDSTDLRSGNSTNELASATASTGSEDVDAGDVIFFAQSSVFPVLIAAPQVLTVRHVTTAVAGEVAPFIVCRWQGIDGRPRSVWTDIT